MTSEAFFTDRPPEAPPIYRVSVVAPGRDVFEVACRQAATGAETASLYYAPEAGRAACAVVLSPEEPLRTACLVSYVAHLGIGDALGAVVPPAVPVTYGWPDRIEVNGAVAGGIRIAAGGADGPGEIPEWMVAGMALRLAPDEPDDSPGKNLHHTSFYDEGCGELDAVDIVERFSRHFLYWVQRWQDEGFGPVRTNWLARATGAEEAADIIVAGRTYRGRIKALDDGGGLLLEVAGECRGFELRQALLTPTWSL